MSIYRFDTEITAEKYSQIYLEFYEELDEIRAICEFYFPRLSEKINQILSCMNLYWGNFREVIIADRDGKTFEDYKRWYIEALFISQEICECCYIAKDMLREDFNKI